MGSFTLAEAAGPDDCELLPVAAAVRSLAPVTVDDATGALIANGRVLPAWDGPGPWAVFDDRERLLAVYERFGGRDAKPAVVAPTGNAWGLTADRFT